ncbi:MAG: type II toxin-antitoxin system YafQ family toxin [Rickettsiales bacterium]
MLHIYETSQFKKDSKRVVKQGKSYDELIDAIEILAAPSPLSAKYRDHALSGNWQGYRECHVRPDWLLIYAVQGDTLFLARTGSHAELFK